MNKKRKLVKLEFEDDLLEKVNALKNYYDVQSNAELVRVLVNENMRQLNVGPVEAIKNER
jgi:hypothetical protein